MSTPSRSVNAWIFLGEDEPSGTIYQSATSSYQSLITYRVYDYLDMVNICFVNTLPTSGSTVPAGNGSTHTIQLQTVNHPCGYTNQQYMDWLIQDARQVNPNIKILVTLGYAAKEFSQIFSGPQSEWAAQAASYAGNVVAYLQNYGLNGLDIDWEGPFSSSTTATQARLVLTALRTAFNAAGSFYLTLSPDTARNLHGSFVNPTVDFLNLQLYSYTSPSEFIQAGIAKSLLAYGAKFEVNETTPYQNAQDAYRGYQSGDYTIVTQWRLNSNDFQFEQAQQMILYQLVYGIPGTSFTDTPIVGAAGNPLISEMVVRSGEVLDAIQVTNAGNFKGTPVQYILPQHGGNSGSPSTVAIQSGDAVVQVSGYTGVWFGWNCVLQITLTTRSGKVFGPFGTMGNASSKTPFTDSAPQGQSIVAFSGSIVNVPLAGGGTTDIIASLTPTYA